MFFLFEMKVRANRPKEKGAEKCKSIEGKNYDYILFKVKWFFSQFKLIN